MDQLSADLASLRIDRGAPPKRSRVWGWLVAAAVLGGLGYGGFLLWPRVEAQLFKTSVEVAEISSISPAQASIELTATGYVIPQVVAKVSSKVTGRLTAVHVREGQAVSAETLLFELDPADEKRSLVSAQARSSAAWARVRVARANLQEAELQRDRARRLVEGSAAPAAELEDAEARVAGLRAQVEATEAEARATAAEAMTTESTLRHFAILAPIAGTAISKPAELGDVVAPGQVLVELADFEQLLIEADVPEAKFGRIKLDGPCEVVFDAQPDQRFRGKVVEIGPQVNRAKATGLVKVALIDRPTLLRPQMSVRVSFLNKPLDEAALQEKPKVVVPSAALVERGGQKAVFVVEEGKVRLVQVALGAPLGGGFEVTSGPPPGTRVVRDPPPQLADGQSIKEKAQ